VTFTGAQILKRKVTPRWGETGPGGVVSMLRQGRVAPAAGSECPRKPAGT